MSRNTSLLHSLRETPTGSELKSQYQIALVDHTLPQDQHSVAHSEVGEHDAEQDGSEAQNVLSPVPSFAPLLKTFTHNSLRQSVKHQLDKQKYRGRTIDNYEHADEAFGGEAANAPQPGEEAGPRQTNYLERGRQKAKTMLRQKRTLHKASEEDSVIDILYENQRGAFLFGVPIFSSNSLFQFDPKPWQNAAFRTSPVDIRNAQVPDPSWYWAWKSWYVDMSRDVDEEGWEYSFAFKKPYAWHGNHPWFHSFVRRRRWLRKRVRRDAVHKTKESGHELTAEYFTIHPKTVRSPSQPGSRARSTDSWARIYIGIEELDINKVDIADFGSLMFALRKASVDREKLVAVRKFINQASGDELSYLAEHMSEIMSRFLYQSSRRQLLSDLMQQFDDASRRRESLATHKHEDDGDQQREHDAASSKMDNLLKAVEAADEQVKQLEYWSDIKGMARNGEALLAADERSWDPAKWRGLDPGAAHNSQGAFESKQDSSQPPPELHKHPEPRQEENQQSSRGKRRRSSIETDSSGYATAPSVGTASVKSPPGPGFKSPTWLQRSKTADSELELEAYTTATEAPGTEHDRRSVRRGLDGVLEEEDDEEPGDAVASGAGAIIQNKTHKQQDGPVRESTRNYLDDEVPESDREVPVEVVEPKAIDADYGQEPAVMPHD